VRYLASKWCELENRVRVRSSSLEMAPFDRSHTSSCSPSIVGPPNYGDILYRLGDSDLLVENREIFIPHLYLARRNFVKMFDAGITRMIGLP